METARIILERGGAVGIFPEGTRVRPGPLAEPRAGAGRLALETGAPIIPVAITGYRRHPPRRRFRLRRVTIRCGQAMTFPRPLDVTPRAELAREVTRPGCGRACPLQWEWLGGHAPRPARRRGWRRQLGDRRRHPPGSRAERRCSSPAGLPSRRARLAAARSQLRPTSRVSQLPGPASPPTTAAEVDFAHADLVCMAVPAQALPAALGSLEDASPPQLGVLVLSKGLVGPTGPFPRASSSESAGGAPGRMPGGPRSRSGGRRTAGRRWCWVSRTERFAALLAIALRGGGVSCETSSDLVGVELAGVAKNAAALAAAAALPAGANAAGAAAGRIYAECHALASASGAQARDLQRSGRYGRPDCHRAGRDQPQPAGRRDAGRWDQPGRDPGPDRTGARGARAGARAGTRDARRGRPRAGHHGAGGARRGPCPARSLGRVGQPGAGALAGRLSSVDGSGGPPVPSVRWTSRATRPSWTANSRTSTGSTCATSTTTRTTGPAITTMPRTSPPRRSCRPTRTSNAHSGNQTDGHCAHG